MIHYDPVSTNDLELEEMREFVEQVLVKRDERLLVHDFRMREKEGKTELMFDLVLPDTMQEEKENIRKDAGRKSGVCRKTEYNIEHHL